MENKILLAAVLAAAFAPTTIASAQQSDSPSYATDGGDSAAFRSTAYSGRNHYWFNGTIVGVSQSDDRITVRSDADRRYQIDTYNAEVRMVGGSPDADELVRGSRVRVVGRLLSENLIEASRVTILAHAAAPPEDEQPLPEGPLPAPPPPLTTVPVDLHPAPPPAPPAEMVNVQAYLSRVDPATGSITALGEDDKTYNASVDQTDIILPGSDRSGTIGDLARGMRVRLIGTKSGTDTLVADRIRVLASADAVTIPAPAPPAAPDLSMYTGVIIDASAFPNVQRSPSPAIYGPDGATLLYPDRSHVPTPDEVQEESIVRYYRTPELAKSGVGGNYPLVLQAVDVTGPGSDNVVLSAEDAALFKALDQRLHFTQTWKVGILIPADR